MKPINILLVADEEDDYAFIRNLLAQAKSEEFHLEWAQSYREGELDLETRNYDIALVDYDLGLHTGAEFVREAAHFGIQVPVILFTRKEGWNGRDDAFLCDSVHHCLLKREMTSESLENAIIQEVNWKQVRSFFKY